MTFVRLVYYLNRPYPSKTHRSGNLFRNTAITIQVRLECDIMIEQPNFGQKVRQCLKA